MEIRASISAENFVDLLEYLHECVCCNYTLK